MLARSLLLASLFAFALGCSTEAEPTTPAPTPESPPPPAGETKPTDPLPPPCSGKPGTFHDQPLDQGGATRRYWLHVPATYACATPTSLLVDFHGTGFGSETDTVEESWATPELVSAADDLGFIVVRPRSRSKKVEGGFVYQWDIGGPSDVSTNKAFASALVEDLRARYHIDPKRIYATGFSNGPSMAAQFLADEPSVFSGYGLIAGGLNAPLAKKSKFGADAPRIYTMTGFRDYMLMAKDTLDAFLSKNAFPKERLFDRESDTGHEVYGWHFREAFTWMDRGTRPAPGTLAAGFTAEKAGDESIIELAEGPSGTLLAGGARGGIWARDGQGTWTAKATIPALAPITDLCVAADGKGFAVGHGKAATTSDGGSTWSVLPAIPEFNTKQFGYTYATTVGCTASRITVGGVWSTATSVDGGKTWSAGDMAGTFASAVRPSSNGWLAVGYWNYAGSSVDGVTFEGGNMPGNTQWWNDVASVSSTNAIAIGEGGAIARRAGGSAWTIASAPTTEDLYAIATRGAKVVAVGAHGAVIVSTDGGATFSDRSTGLDGFLGGVRFVSDTTVVIAGEKGSIVRLGL